MKKPWTDPNPQLGRPGIARRFAVPTVHDAAGKPVHSTGRGRKSEYDDAPEWTEAQIKSAVMHVAGKPVPKRSKGHGRVVLPKVMKASELPAIPAPPALGKSTSTGTAKAIKSAKAKKRGRPATGKTPWLDAGVSRATYFRRQGRKSG